MVAARDLGASDVVHDEFVVLADETGLTAQLWGGRQDVEHIVTWGQRGWCPFGRRRPSEVAAVKPHIEDAIRDVEEVASKLDPWTREWLRRGALR